MNGFDKNSALAILDKYRARPASGEGDNDTWTGNAKAFGLGLLNLPGKAVDTLGAAWDYTDVKGSDLEAVKAERDEQMRTVAARKAEANDTLVDIMESLPYSVATMGAGAAGSVFGPAGALGASGSVAHRASVNEKVKELLIESEIALGRPPTDEEFERIKAKFNDYLMEQGLAEAVPEAVSNLALGGIVGKAGKAIINKAGITNRLAVGGLQLGLGAAEEVPSEVLTGMLQGASDAKVGFRETAPTVGEVFSETAPTAAGQAVMLGLGLKGAGALARRFGKSKTGEGDAGTTPSNSPDNPFAQDARPEDGYEYIDPLNLDQLDPETRELALRGEAIEGELTDDDPVLHRAADERGWEQAGTGLPFSGTARIGRVPGGMESDATGEFGQYAWRESDGSWVQVKGFAGDNAVLDVERDGQHFEEYMPRRLVRDRIARAHKERERAPAIPMPANSPEIDLMAQGSGQAEAPVELGVSSVATEQDTANVVPNQPVVQGVLDRPNSFGLPSVMPESSVNAMIPPSTGAPATGDNMTPVAAPASIAAPIHPAPTIPNPGFGLAGVQPVQPQKVEPLLEVLPEVEPISAESVTKQPEMMAENVTPAKPLSTESSTKNEVEDKSKSKGESGKSLVERMEERALERKVFHYKGKKVYPKMKPLADPERESEFAAKLAKAGTKTLNAGDVVALANVYKLRDEYNERGLASDEAMKELDEILAFEYTPKNADVFKKETTETSTDGEDQATVKENKKAKEADDAVERPVDILEPDSEGRPAENGVGEESLFDDGRGDGEAGREGPRGAGEEISEPRGEGFSRPATSSSGERRDSELAAQEPSERGERGSVPGSSGRGRSSGDGNDGLVSGRREPDAAPQPAAEGSGQVKKEEPKGLREVRKALPKLFEGQQEDVYFAEQRWKRGLGVLFTNGTGTGKTGLGLGAIKRLVDAGRNNILVAVPADKIGSDWVTLGQVLGVDVTKLEDTKDKGRGVTITTHANMAQNNAIFNREWDLVVIDECHKLIASKDGTKTNLLEALRGLTYHPAGAFVRAQKVGKGPELWDEYEKARDDLALEEKSLDSTDAALAAANARYDRASKAWIAHLEKVEEDVAKPRPGNRANLEYKGDAGKPGVMLLSATPFAYEKSVEYADGYLFDFDRTERGGYNEPSGFEKFMVEHFGYRMRYNKLTEPEAGVDRGLLQRQFNSWLKKLGALSSRQLDTPFDYDRKFILTENAIGQKVDEGFSWLWEHHSDYPVLEEHLRKRFNFLRRQYLLETIKANEAVPLIRENVELGRKVVVFYQYNKPIDMEQSLNPFDVSDIIRGEEATGNTELFDEARNFAKERPDLQRLDLNSLRPSLETLKTAFPNAVVFAGTESKKAREEGVKKFQADDSGVDVILVQADAGEAGISLHDKTGKHQRILFNLGLPVKPVTSIQQEGRIFRAGQQSNAMFRYLNTGTTWERTAFAQTVANRASAAENLALGEEARGLKDAFINAFEESGPANFGDPSEGTGGKQADRELRQLLSDFDRAKALYWANQKKTAKNKAKAKEGKDYFPTPEPLGQKMVEWAGLSEGDRMLEPSAGHGAIARWAPEGVDLTVIEPSEELHSRLLLAVDARRAEKGTFEDHALMNKYNAIVMNPPFGSGGKLAVEHLAKAFRHLAGGGRIVAIIPEGPSANKHFDRWMATFDDAKPGVARPVLVREVSLPSVTFERAGTAVKTRVVILDSVTGDAIMGGRVAQMSRVELDSAKTANELFDRLENMEAPAKPGKAGSRPVSSASTGVQADAAPRFKLAETEHAIKKIPMYVATFANREDRVVFDKARGVAKEHDGWYSKFDKNGAIPGFQFTTEQDRADFVREMEEFMGDGDGGAYASLRPSFASNSPYAALRLTPEARDRMNRVVGEVKANAIRGKDAAAAIAQARAWAKANINNPIIKTVERGKVVFDEGGIKDSLSHKPLYQNKLDSVPVIKHVLEDGAYLGSFDDLGGNDIVNHYWAGRARFADGDHLVFVRVREAKGREQRFYVHDVFSDELIKKATPLTREEMALLDQAGSIGNKTGRPGRNVEGVTLDSQRSTLPRGVVLEARILRTIMEVNGQSRKRVQEVVDKLNASAAGAAPVNVVQSFDELPENLKQNFKDREGDLEGVYDEGTVWLVADNLASPERVAEVWMHEQVGHGGFEALMPEKEKIQLLNRLFGMMGGKSNAALRAIAEEYELDLDSRAGQHRALREYLADLAEKEGLSGQEMTRWQRAWKHIADTLKKLVYRLTGQRAKVAEMEVRDLLTAMKARVRDGGPDGPKGGTYASFISDAAKSAADKVAKAMKKPEGFSDDFMESYKNLSEQAKRDLSVWNRFVSQPYALAKKFPLIRSLMDIQTEREDKRREAYTSSMAGVDTFQKMKESDPTAYKYARDLIIALDSETGDKLKTQLDEDMFLFDEDGKRTGFNPKYYAQLRELVMRARNRKTHGDEAAFERAVDAYMGVRRSLDRDLASILTRMEELGFKSREAYLAEFEKRKAELEADETLTKKQRQDALDAISMANKREQEKLDTLRKSMGRRPFYFPRMRFGDYFARFVDADGKTLYRVHYDASTQAQAAYEAAKIKATMEAELKKMGVDLADVKFENGKIEGVPQEVFADALSTVDTQAILERALGRLQEKGEVTGEELTNLRDALFDQVSEVLKSSGFGQHMMRRGNSNIAGYETEDVFKSLSAYKAGLHGWLTKMEASYAFASTLSEAAEDGAARKSPKMYGYAKQYVRDMLRNSDAIDRTNSRIRAGLFLWFLGGNIKSALVNATQNFSLGIPVLGTEIGFGKAYGKILAGSHAAVVDWASKREAGQESKNLSRDEAAFLDDFQKHGEALARKTMELTGMQDRSWTSTWYGKLAEWAGKPIEYAEKFNRLSLALAAYRAAKAGDVTNESTLAEYGEEKGKSWSEASARKFAREVVNEAHFVYGKANQPAPVRGFARGLGFGYTFRTYAQSLGSWYYHMLAGEKGNVGRIAAAQAALHATVLGGVAAIPLYGTMRTVLAQLFGGEPPEEVLGYDQIDILMYGLPSLGGVYLGGSMELDLPAIAGAKQGDESWIEQLHDNVFLAVTGPFGGALDRLGRATYFADTGQTGRVLEELAPTAVTSILKAHRLATTGARTKSGKPIPALGDKSGKPAQLSGAEVILQGLGFQPVSRAKGWQAYQTKQEKTAYKSDFQSDLVTRYVMARANKDWKEVDKLVAEWRDWNKEHPDQKIKPLAQLAKRRERPVK